MRVRCGVWGLALGGALALAGCAGEQVAEQPSFYRSMATHGAEVDSAAAASMISGYRSNNGLGRRHR